MKKLIDKTKGIIKFRKMVNKGKQTLDPTILFAYIKRFVENMGQKVVYSVLLMFYAYKRAETPSWAKNIIMGTLAYVLMPFDALPDLSPLFGFTDDLGVLSFGLVTIACYINQDVRDNSLEHMGKWFSNIDQKLIAEIDEKL